MELKSTWALGGICFLLVLILMGSGSLMLMVYQPFPEFAYASVQSLETQFIFGKMIRSIHYFSANLIVVMLFCHVLRVFFTGGYQGKRALNWMIGMCILTLVLVSCFTGYLLPWDQTAFWAVTICINMFDYIPAGSFFKALLTSGNGVSEKTLRLFFTCHTTLIPAALVLFMGTHFWKVRKAKGVVTSGMETLKMDTLEMNTLKEGKTSLLVASSPNLLLREAVVAAVLIAVVLTVAVFFDAPLKQMANAGVSPNPAKAPWYFSGFQELLLHFHPFFAVFVIPVMIFCTAVFLPFKHWGKPNPGVWFISARAKKAAGTAVLFSAGLTPALILVDEYYLDFQRWLPNTPGIISTGVLPFILALAVCIFFHFGMKKKYTFTDSEAFQTSVIFLITAFVIMTLTCVWFRGSGMKLIIGGA